MSHDRLHAEQLERILVGELDERSPEVHARLAECDECRSELARLRGLEAQLAAAAERQRADFELARRSPTPGDDERVRASLQSALARRTPRARPAGPRLWLAAAAAVLFLLGWGAARYFLEREGAGEITLGSGIEIRAAPDLSEFTWDGAEGVTFFVEVRTVVDGAGGDPLTTAIVTEPRWVPSTEERASWPARIFIQVTAEGASGSVILPRQ